MTPDKYNIAEGPFKKDLEKSFFLSIQTNLKAKVFFMADIYYQIPPSSTQQVARIANDVKKLQSGRVQILILIETHPVSAGLIIFYHTPKP